MAGAAPTTSTTNVTFINLTIPHKVLSAATIAANKTSSPVVAGGTTTVPTNATTVQLTVSAKGAAGGVLNFYPTGNVSGGSGQSLSYPSGSVTASTTIQENIGQSDELTFANSSTGSAIVTATITGYSTQVTAGTINGTGGSPGQVLTNNGATASWGPPGGAAYSATGSGSLPSGYTLIASVSVPAGSYQVSYNAQIFNFSHDEYVDCDMVSPSSTYIAGTYADVNGTNGEPVESISDTALLTTGGGNVGVYCYDFYANGSGFVNATLTVQQVSSVHGAVATGSARIAGRAPAETSPLVP